MKITIGKTQFDDRRAEQVLGTLEHLWREQRGIFRDEFLPQNLVTHPEDPRERANWLLCAVLTQRGGLLSERPFDLLITMRENWPGLFDPAEVFKSWSPVSIRGAFIEAFRIYRGHEQQGLGSEDAGSLNYKLGEHSKAWWNNMAVIHQYWGDDVRNIFDGVRNFEEAFARVDYHRLGAKGLIGMRRKIFSLLVIWLQEQKLIPFFPSPIPVDFHALRVLFATEVIDLLGSGGKPYVPRSESDGLRLLEGLSAITVTESLVNAVTMWSQRFMAAYGYSHLHCNPALWILSRTLCARSVLHRAQNGGTEYILNPERDVSNARWVKLWRSQRVPCVYCPIAEQCKWVIPQAPYYLRGRIVQIAPRVSCPGVLPGMFTHDQIPSSYCRVRSLTAPMSMHVDEEDS